MGIKTTVRSHEEKAIYNIEGFLIDITQATGIAQNTPFSAKSEVTRAVEKIKDNLQILQRSIELNTRQNDIIENLESQNESLEEDNDELEGSVSSLQAANKALMNRVKELEAEAIAAANEEFNEYPADE